MEIWLNRIFSDSAKRSFGHGWLSGVLSIVLGILATFSVLALRFPQWLTLPELRELYPLDYVRLAIDLGIWASLALAALSMLLRRRKQLGLTGLAMAALAMALGGGAAPLGPNEGDDIYFGFDWFVLGVLTTAGLFVPLEKAFPLRSEQSSFRAGWLTDVQYFFVSHVGAQMLSVLVLAPAIAFGSVLANSTLQSAVQSIPLLLQFVLCVVVADLMQYWVHRAFHAVPVLWRFHKVHHSVERMDWIAGSRLHLVDVLVTRGLVLLPLIVLGFDEIALFGYLAFVSIHAVFIHANFGPSHAWLERSIVMPRFHHWHHAIEEEAHDRNFAVHLPLFDRLFGTEFMPEYEWPSGYGTHGAKAPHGYLSQLVWPFRKGS